MVFYDVSDLDFDHDDGDQSDKQLFDQKQSFVYSVLVTSAGSTQAPFLMCTLEIPQKLQHK